MPPRAKCEQKLGDGWTMMARMDTQSRINIAITGPLWEPRNEVALKINATRNGNFVESINLGTHYLVCEKHDSKKARIAERYGTAVISGEQLQHFLEVGEFPSVSLPKYTPARPSNLPNIQWTDFYDPARWYRLVYRDAEGFLSARTIIATAACDGWLGAYDGPEFKTFRSDRIIALTPTNALR